LKKLNWQETLALFDVAQTQRPADAANALQGVNALGMAVQAT
jgi:hypothetical protein